MVDIFVESDHKWFKLLQSVLFIDIFGRRKSVSRKTNYQ